MLCKKVVYNGLGLEVYTHLNFQMPLSFLILTSHVSDDKQTDLENHLHQKNSYQGKT